MTASALLVLGLLMTFALSNRKFAPKTALQEAVPAPAAD
jgi:hypothetical protein